MNLKNNFYQKLGNGLDDWIHHIKSDDTLWNLIYSLKERAYKEADNLEKRGRINTIDENGNTLLLLAITNNFQLNVVIELIEFGADINAKNFLGNAALHLAASHNRLKAVKVLINNNAEINLQEDIFGCSALHIAACKGHLEIVKFLVENGANFDLKSNTGKTALDYAIKNGHKEIVDFLRQKIAEADPTNAQLSFENPQKLMKRYCQIEKLINRTCSYEEAQSLLNGNYGNLIRSDETLMNIIDFKKYAYDKANELKETGTIDISDDKYNTALLIAIYKDNLDLVIELLKLGARTDILHPMGHTALSIAIERNNLKIIEALINHKADINLKNPFASFNTLSLAASEGYLEIVNFLVENGADGRNTALDYAEKMGQKKVADFLCKKMAEKVTTSDQPSAAVSKGFCTLI